MAAADFNTNNKDRAGRHGTPPPTGVRGTTPSMVIKPGPAGGLPGKVGPNRSNGIKRGKTYAKSEGI